MSDEDYRLRQEDEVLAISSMYPEQLVDMRLQDAWKVWRPPHIAIRISDSIVAASVRSVIMKIKMSKKYPDVVPQIEITDALGLRDNDVKLLNEKLIDHAKSQIGQEMVMDLINQVVEFLKSINRPVFQSLHEETAYHEKRTETEILRHRQQEIENQSTAIEERRQLVLHVQEEREQEIRKQKRRHRTSAGNTERSELNPSNAEVSSKNLDDISSRLPLTRSVKFDTRNEEDLICSRLDGLSDRGSILYLGIDTETGHRYRVQEFIFKFNTQLKRRGKKTSEIWNKDLKSCRDQFPSFERQLNVLLKLNHTNLINYVNISLVETDNSFGVMILQEWLQGFNLCGFLRESYSVDLVQCRRVADDICNALAYLHSKDVLHRDLRCDSVFLCEDGCVRIADYSLCPRLSEGAIHVAGVSVDDVYHSAAEHRVSKRSDIYRLGIVLLSVLKGRLSSELDSDTVARLPPVAADFLRRCLVRDEQCRWSADQLLEHAFIRERISTCINGVAAVAANQRERAGEESSLPARPLSPPVSTLFELGCSDRLHCEYDVLEQAGKGGYGSVIKVRHRLDGQLYAIKQVELDTGRPKECQKIIKEAIVLSRLQHDNVVRYFSAWKGSVSFDGMRSSCEDAKPVEDESKPARSSDVAPEPVAETQSSRWNTSCDNRSLDYSSSSDSGAWCPPKAATIHERSEDFVVFEGNDNDENRPEETSSLQRAPSPPSVTHEVQYLFIQMEFCERKTLRTAILDGLHADNERIWRIYREILEGLYYIHRQGLIHRDLKPDNIFLQHSVGQRGNRDIRVKLGDFGLAVSKERRALPVADAGLSLTVSVGMRTDKSQQTEAFECTAPGVGTVHYRAPELCWKAGGDARSHHYTNKVDIFSLGVIFFEMCHCAFETLAERHRVLEQLRLPETVLPDDVARWLSDQQVRLVGWMLSHDSAARPTAGELLASDLVPPHSRDEALFDERLRQALVQPASARYRRLVDACFERRQCCPQDELYDSNLYNQLPTPADATALATTCRRICAVFEQFGAVLVSLPLLSPAASESHMTDSHHHMETVMSGDGVLLQLPRCLRAPLARLMGRNAAPAGRRYAVQQVFVRQRPGGVHPRQQLEAIYSVLAPAVSADTPVDTAAVLADAELMAVAATALAAIPALPSSVCTLYISHALLVEAALVTAHVTPAKWPCLLSDLSRHQRYFSYEQVQGVLLNHGLSHKTCASLAALLTTRCEVSAVMSAFRGRSQVLDICRRASQHLETVHAYAKSMGVSCTVQVHIGLIVGGIEHAHFGGGILLQLVRHRRVSASSSSPISSAAPSGWDVLAAGGRCNPLLSRYWHLRPRGAASGQKPPPFGCVSVFVERCAAVLSADSGTSSCSEDCDAPFQVVVVDGSDDRAVNKRQLEVVRRLRGAGLRVYFYLSSDDVAVDEVFRWSRILRAAALVFHKPADANVVLVCLLRESSTSGVDERRAVAVCELVNYLATNGIAASQPGATFLRDRSSSTVSAGDGVASSRAGGGDSPVHLYWLVGVRSSGGKLKSRSVDASSEDRSKLERQLLSGRHQIPEVSAALDAGHTAVHVIATDLCESDLERLTALRVNEPEAAFWRSVSSVNDRGGGSGQRRSMTRLCDVVASLRAKRCVIVLYSVADDSRRVLLCAGREVHSNR